jgi:hypothetical protein
MGSMGPISRSRHVSSVIDSQPSLDSNNHFGSAWHPSQPLNPNISELSVM